MGVSPLQLVNLHRNQRYFVIKLHTWFCPSYFLKTNITFYCIYQYFMSINSFFNTVSVSWYSRNLQLQLVNLHRNQRYFVIKLHTWFCLSYFMKTNIKFYCIYQYFMSINSFFNTICFSIQPPDYSDPWPRLAHPSSFFLIRLFNYHTSLYFFWPLYILYILLWYMASDYPFDVFKLI